MVLTIFISYIIFLAGAWMPALRALAFIFTI